MGKILPRYPIYIPSKGRASKPFSARTFDQDGVPYRVVVEPSQVEAYKEWDDRGMLLVLPENNKGLVYARNWIKDHAVSEGHERHWQFDDDIHYISRLHRGYRIRCDAGVALAACEDFVDRYENVALAALNSDFFIVCNGSTQTQWDPFRLNFRCYTAFLMMNSLPNRWRYRYNEDTDMTLQVLADGWCTILFNAFMIKCEATENNSTGNREGGGQAAVYSGDGRLKMARELERVWPGVVETKRRFNRPQHAVKDRWMKFDTKLVPKKGIGKARDYGLKLVPVGEGPKTREMKRLLSEEAE